MTLEEITALRELLKAATPGPWEADTESEGDFVLWTSDAAFLANIVAGEPLHQNALGALGFSFDEPPSCTVHAPEIVPAVVWTADRKTAWCANHNPLRVSIEAVPPTITIAFDVSEANAKLAAAAVNALPALLDAAEERDRLAAEVKALHRQLRVDPDGGFHRCCGAAKSVGHRSDCKRSRAALEGGKS